MLVQKELQGQKSSNKEKMHLFIMRGNVKFSFRGFSQLGEITKGGGGKNRVQDLS